MGEERIKRKLGFVGLGRMGGGMGGGMAANMVKRADNLMLYDISTEKRAEFESRHHVTESLDYQRICNMKDRDGRDLIIIAGVSVTRSLPMKWSWMRSTSPETSATTTASPWK